MTVSTRTIPRKKRKLQPLALPVVVKAPSTAEQANAKFVLVVSLLTDLYHDEAKLSSDHLGGLVNNFAQAFRKAPSREAQLAVCADYLSAIRIGQE